MKTLFTFNAYYLLLFISFNWTFAQTESPQNPSLYPIEENGLYGFINEKGERIIPPSFHAVGLFSEGLAAARKDGLYGFIDDFDKVYNYSYILSFQSSSVLKASNSSINPAFICTFNAPTTSERLLVLSIRASNRAIMSSLISSSFFS